MEFGHQSTVRPSILMPHEHRADRDARFRKYREDAEQPHWYPWIFQTEDVQAFIDAPAFSSRSKQFTLTVAVPSESGSMHGWRIENLAVPGR